MSKKDPPNRFKKLLEVLVAIAAIAATVIAWLQYRDKRELEVDVDRLKRAVAELRDAVAKRDETITRQREDLERSFGAFARNYRAKMEAAASAVEYYGSLRDTPENRREMGTRFDREKAERLEKARIRIQALLDFVKGWRPVQDRFHATANGRVTAIDENMKAGKDADMLRDFAVLKENLEAELERLRLALESAVKATR